MMAPPSVAATRIPSAGVRLEALGYGYDGAPGRALDRIDLQVDAGEFVCLLGPSGCGKSTLLRLIAGLLRPTEGHVGVDGERVRPLVGWMAQRDGLLPWRRVLDNVALPLELRGQSRRVARATAQQSLDRVGLGDAGHLFPHQLSGGMRQRAALARAVVHEPGLLLLDEPFAHLDELTRDDLGDELIHLWKDQSPTIIMVTHSALEAVRLADRVVVLSPGPGQIVGEIDIGAERPRYETDPQVIEALRRARTLLRGFDE